MNFRATTIIRMRNKNTGRTTTSKPAYVVGGRQQVLLGRPTTLSQPEGVRVLPDEITQNETISLYETYTDNGQFRSSLSVASSSSTSGVSSTKGNRVPTSPLCLDRKNRSGTPTWTEGTPSFTESSDSADLVCSSSPTPNRGVRDLDPKDTEADENENEMV